jgi:autotransporter-associated beta strand protein
MAFRPYRNPANHFVFAALAMLAFLNPAFAQRTWLPATGGTYSWNDPNNWSGAALPLATDLATFGLPSTDQILTLDANQSVLGLNFTNTAGTYTINPGGSFSLTIGASGITTTTGAGVTTITANVVLAAAAPATSQNWVLNAALTINGNLSGPDNINKNGTGILQLGGTNSYTGLITVSQGTIQFNGANAMSTAGKVRLTVASLQAITNFQIGAGTATTGLFDASTVGVMQLTPLSGASGGGLNVSQALDFTPAPGLFLGTNAGGANTILVSGTITPGATGYRLGGGGSSTVASSSILEVSSPLTGSNDLIAFPGGSLGNLTLSGTNTYSGTTTINQGILRIGGGHTVTTATTGDLGNSASVAMTNAGSVLVINRAPTSAYSYSGVISGIGSLFVQGGTITLSGTNTFTGGFTYGSQSTSYGFVSATGGSTLRIGSAAALASGNVTFRPPNSAIFWENTTSGSLTLTNSSFNMGSGGTASVLEFTGANPLNTGTAPFNLSVFNGTSFTTTTNGYISVAAGAATLTIGGPLVGTSTALFQKGGGGTLILSAASPNYLGAINAGVNTSLAHFAVPNRGGPLSTTVAVQGFGTQAQVRILNTGVLGFLQDSDATFTNGTVPYNVFFDASTNTVHGFHVAPSGTNTTPRTLTIGNITYSSTSTIFIPVTGSNGYILKTGSFTNTAASSSTTTQQFQPTTGSIQFTDYASGNTGTNRLWLEGTSSNNAVLGLIGTSGTALVRKFNSSSWTLSGVASTYTGTTVIEQGELRIAKIANLSTASSIGAPTTVANGTIALGATTNTGQLTYIGTGDSTDRVINLLGTTGGGTIDQSGTGTLAFTSNFTATGGGAKTLTLQGSTAGIGQISGNIPNNSATNTTSVTKLGTGRWILSGNTTYSGATTVSAGTLLVNGTHTPSVANSGAYLVNGTGVLGGSGTLAGGGTQPVAVATGGTLAPGNAGLGTLTSTKAVSFAGGATFAVELGAVSGSTGASDTLAVSGATPALNFTTGSVLKLSPGTGFNLVGGEGDVVFTIGTVGAAANLQENAGSFVGSTYTYGSGSVGNIVIDVGDLPAYAGGTFILSQSGNNLVLTANVLPVPEPAAVLALACLGVLAAGGRISRKAKV